MRDLEPQRNIVVCVFALKHAEYMQYRADLPEGVKQLLTQAEPGYGLAQDGAVYGGTRDEWKPFEDSTTILQYLQRAELRPISLSHHLDDLANLASQQEVTNKVQLYIFDPLFILLSDKIFQATDPVFLTRLEGIIYQNSEFCILVPDRLPAELRQELLQACAIKLRYLHSEYQSQGRGEWEAEKVIRLISFLHRVRKPLPLHPSEDRLNEASDVIDARRVLALAGRA